MVFTNTYPKCTIIPSCRLNRPLRVYSTTSCDNTQTPLSNFSISTCNYYSNSYSIIYTSKEVKENVKKVLKRLMDQMSKEGWVEHNPFYIIPKVIPISLRGTRLDGRGWANL